MYSIQVASWHASLSLRVALSLDGALVFPSFLKVNPDSSDVATFVESGQTLLTDSDRGIHSPLGGKRPIQTEGVQECLWEQYA